LRHDRPGLAIGPYVFFIDFDGHESQAEADAALKDVKDIALEVRVLGSYPKASGQE
jgi:chorismate mutase/prephenate dehydratase